MKTALAAAVALAVTMGLCGCACTKCGSSAMGTGPAHSSPVAAPVVGVAPAVSATADVSPGAAVSAEKPPVTAEPPAALESGPPDEPIESGQAQVRVRDPLQPVNRVFYHFNDKLHMWVLRPAARGYSTVVPQPARVGVRNFLSNIATPIRLVGCLLQAKVRGAGIEVSRFAVNTTLGVAGFGDPAQKRFGLQKQKEDIGQALGSYGLGPGFYINWPILGPSGPRDTIGMVADSFADPVFYFSPSLIFTAGEKGCDMTNDLSLRPGEYEAMKESSLDPYIALRDAYYQHRQHLIADQEE